MPAGLLDWPEAGVWGVPEADPSLGVAAGEASGVGAVGTGAGVEEKSALAAGVVEETAFCLARMEYSRGSTIATATRARIAASAPRPIHSPRWLFALAGAGLAAATGANAGGACAEADAGTGTGPAAGACAGAAVLGAAAPETGVNTAAVAESESA